MPLPSHLRILPKLSTESAINIAAPGRTYKKYLEQFFQRQLEELPQEELVQTEQQRDCKCSCF